MSFLNKRNIWYPYLQYIIGTHNLLESEREINTHSAFAFPAAASAAAHTSLTFHSGRRAGPEFAPACRTDRPTDRSIAAAATAATSAAAVAEMGTEGLSKRPYLACVCLSSCLIDIITV